MQAILMLLAAPGASVVHTHTDMHVGCHYAIGASAMRYIRQLQLGNTNCLGDSRQRLANHRQALAEDGQRALSVY